MPEAACRTLPSRVACLHRVEARAVLQKGVAGIKLTSSDLAMNAVHSPSPGGHSKSQPSSGHIRPRPPAFSSPLCTGQTKCLTSLFISIPQTTIIRSFFSFCHSWTDFSRASSLSETLLGLARICLIWVKLFWYFLASCRYVIFLFMRSSLIRPSMSSWLNLLVGPRVSFVNGVL